MSGSRPSFRAAAAQRLAEDGGALPAAVEEFLSDTRRMAVRLLPLHAVALRPDRQEADGPDTVPVESLVVSVRQHGVLEPILVRPLEGGRYELVAGERRLRAARAAELEAIPAVVREMDEETAGALTAGRIPEAAVAAAVVLPAAAVLDAPAVEAIPLDAAAAAVAADVGQPAEERPGQPGWAFDPVRGSEALRSGDPMRHGEPYRIGDSVRARRATNGTYMPPAVVTRREPVVISGPGIPGPSAAPRQPEIQAPERRAVAGGDAERRPQFRFVPFPFLRRGRDDSGEQR